MALLNFPHTRLNGDPLQNGDTYTGTNGVVYIYNNGKWIGHSTAIAIATTGTGGSIIQSDSAPATTSSSALWYDTVGGRTYVYYNNAWIDAAPDTTLPAAVSVFINDAGYLTSSTVAQYVTSSGFSTTSTLINGLSTLTLGTDGILTLPNGSTITDKIGTLSQGPEVDTQNISDTIGVFHGLDFTAPNGVAVGWTVNGPGVSNASVFGLDVVNGFVQIDSGVFQVGESYTFTGPSAGIAGVDITVDSNNWTLGTDGTLTAPGNIYATSGTVYANGLDTIGLNVAGQIVIPNDGVAGGLVSQNGQGNIYFDTDNSLLFIITSTYQVSFNADGTVTFPGYVFPLATGVAGQVLVAGDNPLFLEWQSLPTAVSSLTNDLGYLTSATVNQYITPRFFTTSTLVNGSSTITLGADGGLTFPDHTVQTTAWNDQSFMSSLASYDGAVAFNTATVGVGGLTVNGPVEFNGPFTFQGTATVINSNSGTFFGDIHGVGALYAGVAGSVQLPATVIQSAADVNDYIQNNFQNLNHGVTASTEWVATNDTGNDSNNYIDMGIAGHGWDGTQANSVGTAAEPSDSWVYTQGTVSTNEGGNLILGTIKDGKAVKILAGSSGSNSIVAQFDSTGLTLNTGTGIVFADGSVQSTAVTTGGTLVLGTLNVTNVSATNITINGQSVLPGVTRITAGTGTHVSTSTGALTLWVDTFNTSTLVAQSVTALSIPYANVTGTPNLSGYATQSTVSTLQITVNNLTNTVSTLPTTATVQALIANSLTNYSPTSSVQTLIANSLTNVIKTIIAGTGTAVSVSGNTVTIWTTATGGIANLTNLSGDISFSTVGVGAPTFNTTSSGVKISYYPSETASTVDYATGIEAGVLWNSIPSATNNFAFKWYGGTSTVASLNGLGTLTANKFVGDGSSLTNVTVTQQANIVGVQPNVTLVAGNYSYVFDNTSNFTMPTNGDIIVPGASGNINVGNTVYAAQTGTTGGYAFVAGPGASSQAALLLQGLPGVAANMAIRDNSTVSSNIYYDVSIGGTNNGTHQFRGTSAYTQYAQIDRYGINLPTRPAFRVYGAGTTNNLSTTQNTNGILNGNNFAVDYNQGTALSTSTGVFTAPVAGLYSVHLIARVTSNTAGQAQVTVIKNYATSAVNQAMWETGANPSINHFGVSTISKLAAGDTLVLKVTLGTINFDANDSWAVAYIG